MAIVQGHVKITRLADAQLIGSGRCAMHLADPSRVGSQHVSGTVIVEWTDTPPPSTDEEEEYRVEFADGRWLNVVFTKLTQSDCGPKVLRFRGRGPLQLT